MSAMPNPDSVEIGIEHRNKPAVLPMLQPTIGPPMADVRALYREAGCYIYVAGIAALWGPLAANEAELRDDGRSGTRIFRARQLYTGPTERELVPLAERAAHEPFVG